MGTITGEVKGVVLGYRRSKAVQYNNQVLVKLFVSPKNIANTIGTKIVAKDAYGNTYRGKIIKVHSYRNSVVVAKFKPNIPGQLIGEPVVVVEK